MPNLLTNYNLHVLKDHQDSTDLFQKSTKDTWCLEMWPKSWLYRAFNFALMLKHIDISSRILFTKWTMCRILWKRSKSGKIEQRELSTCKNYELNWSDQWSSIFNYYSKFATRKIPLMYDSSCHQSSEAVKLIKFRYIRFWFWRGEYGGRIRLNPLVRFGHISGIWKTGSTYETH